MPEHQPDSDTVPLPPRILDHPAWKRLRARGQASDRCDPFRALGVAGREKSYSKLLGWLLRERRCAAFTTAWLNEVLATDAVPKGRVGLDVTDGEGQPLDAIDLDCQSVTTEFPLPSGRYIDVVAQYSDADEQRLVLAIENKIGQGESPNQLSSYAEELLEQYGGDGTIIVVVFLTPTGRMPISLGDAGADDDRLHARLASWQQIGKLLEKQPPDREHEEHRLFTQLVTRHLQEGLMGETPDRADTRTLFEDPDTARTLLHICAQQPQLADMHDAWVERVRAWLEGWDPSWADIRNTVHPNRGIREIKIQVRPWIDAGIPLLMMVHTATHHRGPAVRILVWSPQYDKNQSTFTRLAKLADGAIDNQYGRAWSGSQWRRVLVNDRESEEPAAREVHHYAYNEQAVEECLANLDRQFREIEPAVRRCLEEHGES